MAIYEVAFLLSKSVAELRDDMSLQELQGWFDYFERRPAGWREDQRTAMLLNVQGVKKSPAELFPALAALSKPDPTKFQGSAMQSFLLKATGGDVLPFL